MLQVFTSLCLAKTNTSLLDFAFFALLQNYARAGSGKSKVFLLFYANLLNLNDKVAKPSSKPDENFVSVNFQSFNPASSAWTVIGEVMDKNKSTGIFSAKR